MRGALLKPRQVRWRLLAEVLAGLLLLAGTLVWAGAGLPPPRLLLDQSGSRVIPTDYPYWREASDWLAGRKYAVLTFDDGPYGEGVDEKILGVLKNHRARAMFFVVCSHINPATEHVLAEVKKAGSLLGNHSYDHVRLLSLDGPDIEREVEGCSLRIEAVMGLRPMYFRPPFGQTSAQIERVASASGMRQVLWDANSQDSWLVAPDQIVSWSREQTADGSILLMHSKPETAAVLDRVLAVLEKRGFRFVLPVPSRDYGDRGSGD